MLSVPLSTDLHEAFAVRGELELLVEHRRLAALDPLGPEVPWRRR